MRRARPWPNRSARRSGCRRYCDWGRPSDRVGTCGDPWIPVAGPLLDVSPRSASDTCLVLETDLTMRNLTDRLSRLLGIALDEDQDVLVHLAHLARVLEVARAADRHTLHRVHQDAIVVEA